ncbi:major facilitator superfamily domain-containing protein 6-like [Macrobrachium nipponense]|uniref:major facilitator superfamily domain-containing protein 6-like n=1 Tax=Macrobrachium nipponense TaxID=159736 RepID=UPI0030C86C41
MHVNRSLLPIKLHYFLRYAGSAFLVMVLPLIARQKGVTPQGIGFLWSTMPIVGLIATSVSGASADYFRAHRTVFLCSLVFLTTGIMAAYGLPSLPLDEGNTSNVLQDISAKFPSPPLDEENAGNVLRSIGAQFTNFSANEEHIRHGLMNPEQTEDSSASNRTGLQFPSVTNLLQDRIDPELIIEEGQFPSPVSRDFSDSEDSSALSYLMKYPQFWLIFGALLIEQMGLSTCVTITDAVCLQILGSERHKYGQQRLWGTIGMGLFSVITGALVDLYSNDLPQTDYLPAVIICVVLMTSDMVLVSRMKISSSKESIVKMGDVGSVIVRPQTLLFFVTAFVMGTSLGLLWVFKLMYIEDVSIAWDPDFANLKLLQGLDIGIETFGGEVPFFFLSGTLIKRLGYNVIFAGCLGTLAIRCCLYYTLSNPWLFLPVEFLNGISYALFHACMAAYASHLAPPGAQATLQALVRALFLIGQSTAGFLGGVLFQSVGGAVMFLIVGIFDAVFCMIFLCSQFLITKYCPSEKLQGFVYDGSSSSSTTSARDSSKNPQKEKNVREEKDARKSLLEDV